MASDRDGLREMEGGGASGKTLFPEIDFAHLSHLSKHSICTLDPICAIYIDFSNPQWHLSGLALVKFPI